MSQRPVLSLPRGARWTEAFLLSVLINAASWWPGELSTRLL